MTDLEIAEQIADNLRQEPYHLFQNNCLIKSLRFRSYCRKEGIKVHLVWCVLGLSRVKAPLLREVTLPHCTHFWGQVQGYRFETSRPLVSHGTFVIAPSEIKPILTVKW